MTREAIPSENNNQDLESLLGETPVRTHPRGGHLQGGNAMFARESRSGFRRPRPLVRLAVLVVSTLTLTVLPMVTNTPAAGAATQAKTDSCNTTSWTWPLCEIRVPSLPRIKPGGLDPRPALTPKNSPWCGARYIKASNSGYTYWALTKVTKYNLRFWPDYFVRYYQLMTWNGRAWVWVPYNSSFPGAIQGQTVYCGT